MKMICEKCGSERDKFAEMAIDTDKMTLYWDLCEECTKEIVEHMESVDEAEMLIEANKK